MDDLGDKMFYSMKFHVKSSKIIYTSAKKTTKGGGCLLKVVLLLPAITSY